MNQYSFQTNDVASFPIYKLPKGTIIKIPYHENKTVTFYSLISILLSNFKILTLKIFPPKFKGNKRAIINWFWSSLPGYSQIINFFFLKHCILILYYCCNKWLLTKWQHKFFIIKCCQSEIWHRSQWTRIFAGLHSF